MTNAEIIIEIKNAVATERKMTARVLELLKIVDERKLYLDRGYSSLFNFAVEYLGYSAPAAWRRISAMKLIKELPQTKEKIISGDLSLTNVAKVQNFFNNERKSNRSLDKVEKIELLKSIENISSRECEKALLEKFPQSVPLERRRELTETKTELRLILDEDLVGQLDRLKNLWSHKNPNMSDSDLLREMAKFCLEKVDPLKGQFNKNTSAPKSKNRQHSRHVPKALKLQIWKKDEGKCRYHDPQSNKFCNSTHLIQIDHKIPWSKGGVTTLSNLQLLCASHNFRKGDTIQADGKQL